MAVNVTESLSEDAIDAIKQRAIALGTDRDKAAAWNAVAPLLVAQSKDKTAALALLEVIDHDCLLREHALAAIEAVYSQYDDDLRIVGLVGWNLDRAFDTDLLNATPLEHSIVVRTVELLQTAWAKDDQDEVTLLEGLSVAARLLGRRKDDVTERAHRRLIEIDPNTPYRHYNYGLFLKTRGRFEEGMQANQRAVELSKAPSEAAQWNLGICATGARRGDIALEVWKAMGHKIKIGRFDLPDGRFPQCKVRLAERPLAERTSKTDDPGEEETIWIERLSACHGIVRSVLYADLGVDYGDVVLFDGAPITYHKYDDEEIAVFPHLATLFRRNYQFFDFAGTQDAPDRLADVSKSLKGDALVYSHTDNFVVLCASCWNDPNTNHARHEEMTKHVVTGRIAAPPEVTADDLLAQLDAGMEKLAPCQIYTPDLCRAAGLSRRADIEQRRFDILKNN